MIKVSVKPMGAVRMTQKGKWTSITATRYMNYKKLVGHEMRIQCKEPFVGPLKVLVTFTLPMPDSWTGKKKREQLGAAVAVKPDIDNLVKGLLDSANKICWQDDNQVTEIVARKRYGYEGAIEMEIEEVRA